MIPPKPTDTKDPMYEKKKRLYEMVTNSMIHTPCENNPNAYCRSVSHTGAFLTLGKKKTNTHLV